MNEIRIIHDYSIIPTTRVSELITECLKLIELNINICAFNF